MLDASQNTKRERNWTFVINNPGPEERNLFDTIECKFCVWQLERGELGTLHIQGYIIFHNPRTFNGLKRIFPRANIKPRRFSHEKTYEYHTKEHTRVEGPFERGDPPRGQGNRSDIIELVELLHAGKFNERQISEQCTSQFLRYGTGIRRYLHLQMRPRSGPCTIRVFWGPTGSGKTKMAYEEARELCTLRAWDEATSIYWHSPEMGKWWDGYAGQPIVIMDDYNGGTWKRTSLLRVIDRYPIRVQCKLGSYQLSAKYFWFTSNDNPEFWYHRHWPALKRRLTENGGEIREFSEVLETECPILRAMRERTTGAILPKN